MAGANRASRLRDDSSAALKAATSGSIFALPAAHLVMVMVMALRRGSPGNRSARVRIRVHSLRHSLHSILVAMLRTAGRRLPEGRTFPPSRPKRRSGHLPALAAAAVGAPGRTSWLCPHRNQARFPTRWTDPPAPAFSCPPRGGGRRRHTHLCRSIAAA